MGYLKPLNEISTTKLQAELDRRKAAGNDGLCAYCGQVAGSDWLSNGELVKSCTRDEMHFDEAAVEAAQRRLPSATPWRVEIDCSGLHWRGDWWAASYLAELLSGEDEGRISKDDVVAMLDALGKGLQS